MSETEATIPRKRVCRWKSVLIVAAVGVLIVAGAWAWLGRKYPYGYSHCCSAGIGLTLRQYAADHHGWFPYGQSTPEASFSLLGKDDPSMIEWIRGKSVLRSVAEAALARDGMLGPDSCGWHYVEGLREDDDPQIAIVWDKAEGLDHNGAFHADVARSVLFLDGSHYDGISKAKWPQFVRDQKERLAKVMASRESNAPPIRWSDEATLGPNRFPAPVK